MPRGPFDPPLFFLVAVVALFWAALWLRLMGTAWDGWAGLHPDERHMAFVTMDALRGLDRPEVWQRGLGWLWFAPESPLNPRAEGRLYVYGELPVLVVTFLARLFQLNDWGSTLLIGRSVSAALDASIVLAVFMLAQRLLRRPGPALAAAALYALAPIPLQLANFYTVDAWASALAVWALVPMVALAEGRGRAAPVAGLLAGLAVACKISTLGLLAPALVAVLLYGRGAGAGRAALAAAAGVLAGLVALRIASPFSFAGPGVWGLAISPMALEDFHEIGAYFRDTGPPPNWFWVAGYPASALLRDLALFGSGPVLALLALPAVGLGLRLRPVVWVLLAALVVHLVAGVWMWQWVLRYFAPAVPVVAVLSGVALARLPKGAVAVLLALALWWGAGAVRLHLGPHPRVVATEWMRGLPPGTAVAVETDWDESLPVTSYAPVSMPADPPPGPFRTVPLRLTDAEDAGTARRLAEALDQSDYVTISSGRQSEVMPRLPERFPVVTRYYAALADGRLCFTRVFVAEGGYPLPFWPFDDRFAQEPWRVYDHPVVQIWRKEPCFDRVVAEGILAGRDGPGG